MHPNAEAVARAAASAGLAIAVAEFPDGTRTAADAARAVGVEIGQIVKSLVFRIGDDVVVALVSGANQLDEGRLGATRVDAAVVRDATGYPIGGVPPFGHATPMPVLIDRDLLQWPEVWAAAGTPRHVFPIAPADLVRVSGGTVTDLAAPAGTG